MSRKDRQDKLDDARKRLNMLEYCQGNSEQPSTYTKLIGSVQKELKQIKEEWQKARERGELQREYEEQLKEFRNNNEVDIT